MELYNLARAPQENVYSWTQSSETWGEGGWKKEATS